MGHKRKDEIPTAPATAETLNEDQLQALFFTNLRKVEAAIGSFETARAAVKEAYKVAEADGVSKKEIDIGIKARKEGGEEKLQKDIERHALVAKWLGVPIGTQKDLFEIAPETHREAGKRAGMDDQPCKPPPNLGQGEAQHWITGFHEGREAINVRRATSGFKPIGDAASTMTQ